MEAHVVLFNIMFKAQKLEYDAPVRVRWLLAELVQGTCCRLYLRSLCSRISLAVSVQEGVVQWSGWSSTGGGQATGGAGTSSEPGGQVWGIAVDVDTPYEVTAGAAMLL